jgi:hypothetical protein
MVLQILSNFSLYRDIATMYLDVDTKVIMPGLIIVDRLALPNMDPKVSDKAFFEKQRQTLSDYNTQAEETVHAVVKTVCNSHRSLTIMID